jgi:hypothetical protein
VTRPAAAIRIKDAFAPEYSLPLPDYVLLQARRLGEAFVAAADHREGLPAIDQEVVSAAWATMNEVVPRDERLVPYVIPTYEGGFQLEWPLADLLIEIEIAPSGARFVSIETAAGEPLFEGDYAAEGRDHAIDYLNDALLHFE